MENKLVKTLREGVMLSELKIRLFIECHFWLNHVWDAIGEMFEYNKTFLEVKRVFVFSAPGTKIVGCTKCNKRDLRRF